MNASAASEARWIHEQPASPEALIRRAMTYVHEHGLPLSQSKASRMIRAHIREVGLTEAERTLLPYVLAYKDPTGETAARNVDGGARR